MSPVLSHHPNPRRLPPSLLKIFRKLMKICTAFATFLKCIVQSFQKEIQCEPAEDALIRPTQNPNRIIIYQEAA
jgi:hypothetical protein